MTKAKNPLKARAKKTLAVISSVALILSCGTTGLFTANAAETNSTVASEATDVATQMRIFSTINGVKTDITDNPIVYVDNSAAAEGNTTVTLTAEVKNDAGKLTETTFSASLEAQPVPLPHVKRIKQTNTKGKCEVTLRALEYDSSGKEVPYLPGTTHFSFAAADGTLYRTVTVVVYAPATDTKLYWGNKDTLLGLNDLNESNSMGVQAIANHQYPIYHDFSPSNTTDVMEYSVYEGYYSGTGTGKPTTKAEINQQGIFTPKKNGVVTIVAKGKATETSDRWFSKGEKLVIRYEKAKIDGVETLVPVQVREIVQTMPKYIFVTIVKENPAKSLNITNPIYAMEANDTYQFEINAEPTYSKEQGYETGATDVFRWESSNPEIATVDQKGLVTALKKGDVKITVYAENDTVYSECDIRVLTKATSITLPNTFSTRVGVTEQITATMNPDTADDEVEWKSSDPTIATVEPVPTTEFTNKQTANVTGKKKGTVIITAKAKNSGVEAKRTININDKIATDVLSFTKNTGSTITPIPAGSAVEVYTTKTINISARLTNSSGQQSDDKVTWTVSDNADNKYAVVKTNINNISIQGVSAGRIKITAKSVANKNISKSFYVDVLKSSEIITLYNNKNGDTISSSKSLQINNVLPITAVLTINGNYPTKHNDKIKSWSTDNTSIATVDGMGNIKGISNGVAEITVTTASGLKKSVNITVFSTSSVFFSSNVTAPVNADALPTATIQMDYNLNGTLNLGTTVKNQNNVQINDADLIWTSTNEDVATVTNKGLVKAKDVGTTIITAKSGPQEQSCLLTVYSPVYTNSLTQINGTTTLKEAITPYVYTPGIASYEPHPIVAVGDNILVENVDYKLTYTDNDKPEKYGTKVKITGIGNYNSYIEVPFEIKRRSLNDADITIKDVPAQECINSYTSVTPDPTIYCFSTKLIKDQDYYLSYSDNYLPGTAKVKITGMGNYSDTVEKNFEIYCNHPVLENVKVIEEATYDHTGLEEGSCPACGVKNIQRVTPKLVHTDNPAESLSFEKEEIGLNWNETCTLVPIGVGSKDKDKPFTDNPIKWQSSDENIAVVDDTGKVTAKRAGTTIITAFGENEGVSAQCLVKVLNYKINSLEITPNPAATRVTVATELKAIVDPTNTDDEIIWEVEDPDIAEITSTNGLSAVVLGKSAGVTKVIAKGRYSNISAETTLTVSDRITSESISISATSFDEKFTLPTESDEPYVQKIFSNQDIVFESYLTNEKGDKSDDTVVWTITDNENKYVTLPDRNPDEPQEFDSLTIHGSSEGTVTVTACSKTNPDTKAVFKLQVVKSCDKIEIQDSNGTYVGTRSLDVSDGLQLNAKLTTYDPLNPLNHGDAVKSWVSSNPEVAKVSESGYVTAVMNGSANITVTTESNKTTYATINVFTTSQIYVTGGLDSNTETTEPTLTLQLSKGYTITKTVYATVYDDEASSVSNVTNKWTSANESVVTVDYAGVVTAVGVGSTTITVRSGSKQQSFTAVVIAPIRDAAYEEIPDQVYTPGVTAYEPEVPTITINGEELLPGRDFDFEYKNNTGISYASAYIEITGKGSYNGTTYIYFKVVAKNISDDDVLLNDIKDTQEYTGSYISPEVSLTYKGQELVQGADYTVSYSNNYNESTDENPAIITITGLNNYTGTIIKEFKIVKTISGIYGDVNDDGHIYSDDALSILRASVNLDKYDELHTMLADVDKDGKITSGDSLSVLRCSVGLKDSGSVAGQKIG